MCVRTHTSASGKPGNAGKTTNLFEMCQFFTSRRRSELFSPESRDGRTMWFDWLQIDGGLVAGHGLRCQIVTVPGQLVLRRRRSALLRAADVVVLPGQETRVAQRLRLAPLSETVVVRAPAAIAVPRTRFEPPPPPAVALIRTG